MKDTYGSIKRQQGLGWFGLVFVFGTIAFFAIIVVKVGPLYLNHFQMVSIVKSVANNADMGSSGPGEIRIALQRRWDIDYIKQVEAKDIKIKRTERGRVLAYDYEARANLFYNIFVAIQFKGDHPMKNNTNTDT